VTVLSIYVGLARLGAAGFQLKTTRSVSIGARQWLTEMLEEGEQNARRQRH